MSQPPDAVESLLAATSGIEAPASLRARTLARANEAWTQRAAPDRWRRTWESRPLRLAWAVVTAALVVANLALPLSRKTRPTEAGPVSQREADRELRDLVTLPRLEPSYVGMLGAEHTERPSRERPSSAAQPTKENHS